MKNKSLISAMIANCPKGCRVGYQKVIGYNGIPMRSEDIVIVRPLYRDWGFMWSWLTAIIDWFDPRYSPELRINPWSQQAMHYEEIHYGGPHRNVVKAVQKATGKTYTEISTIQTEWDKDRVELI